MTRSRAAERAAAKEGARILENICGPATNGQWDHIYAAIEAEFPDLPEGEEGGTVELVEPWAASWPDGRGGCGIRAFRTEQEARAWAARYTPQRGIVRLTATEIPAPVPVAPSGLAYRLHEGSVQARFDSGWTDATKIDVRDVSFVADLLRAKP